MIDGNLAALSRYEDECDKYDDDLRRAQEYLNDVADELRDRIASLQCRMANIRVKLQDIGTRLKIAFKECDEISGEYEDILENNYHEIHRTASNSDVDADDLECLDKTEIYEMYQTLKDTRNVAAESVAAGEHILSSFDYVLDNTTEVDEIEKENNKCIAA